MKVRIANLNDLSELVGLELGTFSDKAGSNCSIDEAFKSLDQIIFVIEVGTIVGYLIAQVFDRSIRLNSIAVQRSMQNKGYGRLLMSYFEDFVKQDDKGIITLEADARDIRLINWYANIGYQIINYVEDFYGRGKPAYLMAKKLKKQSIFKDPTKNIIVTDLDLDHLNVENADVVKVKDYINQQKFQNQKNYRVYNFCSDYKYQTVGYYMSLLAEARGQRVFPSVSTIQDILSSSLIKIFEEELKVEYFDEFDLVGKTRIQYRVVLGCESSGKSSRLSKNLYKLFDAPFVEYTFVKNHKWLLEDVRLMTINEVLENTDIPLENITAFSLSKKNLTSKILSNQQYSLAILVNPDEENPPSCKNALEKFRSTAISNGFYVEFITKNDKNRIGDFDALLIRETTAVNDHTFHMARMAQSEGLVVIDDQWSILKCSNKFYLHERLKTKGINMPMTLIVSSEDLIDKSCLDMVNFPVIIKQPDGMFSKGVYKADDYESFVNTCSEILETSQFAIVQEFVLSDYDWRIGIMNNEVLFACKYYMSNDKWQTYFWRGIHDDTAGKSEAVILEEVPSEVLEMAIDATSVLGNGLYGVDIKISSGQCYLIEINDNPNIYSGIEDAILGDVLYDRIVRNIRYKVDEKRKISNKFSA